jgi:hypothetical protein
VIPLLLIVLSAQQPGGSWSHPQSWDSPLRDARLGSTLAAAGDLDGDQCGDVIVGAPQGDLALSTFRRGHVIVYSGNTGSVIHVFDGLQSTDGFGGSVAGLGDVDGDGVPDLIAGARHFVGNYVRVFSGLTGGLLVHHTAPAGADGFGWALAPAGDLDADGRADYWIGARGADPGGLTNAGTVTAYSGLTHLPLLTCSGTAANLFLGKAIAGGEDLDGDGTADLIAHSNGLGAGSVHCFSGATGALIRQHDGTIGQNVSMGHSLASIGDVDLDGCADYLYGDQYSISGGQEVGRAWLRSGLTGNLLWYQAGRTLKDRFGCAVAGLGDINGDQSPDFAVGACNEERNWSTDHRGTVSVFSGAEFMLLQFLPSDDPGFDGVKEFGAAIAGIGDANGDLRADFVVGAPRSGPGGHGDNGRVVLYSFDSFLRSSSASLSAVTGGVWGAEIDFPAAYAGRAYKLIPSPVRPNDELDEEWAVWRGVALPLVISHAGRRMWNDPYAMWSNAQGVLDAQGDAHAFLTAPASVIQNFAGTATRLVAVVLPSASDPDPAASGAMTLRFTP